jgi:hypothetical protein
MILLALVVLIVGGLVLFSLAVHYLGILPALAIALGAGILLFLAVKVFLGSLLRRLFLLPFRMKGAVLRGAAAEVHALGARRAVARAAGLGPGRRGRLR